MKFEFTLLPINAWMSMLLHVCNLDFFRHCCLHPCDCLYTYMCCFQALLFLLHVIMYISYVFQALLWLILVFYISHIWLFSGVAVSDSCVLFFTYLVVFRRCCTWFVWWSPSLSLITSLYTSTHKPVQITTQTWLSWNKCTPS